MTDCRDSDPSQPSLCDLLADPRWLRSVARDVVSDSNLVDDISQDACVYALERPPRHTENVRGWLKSVVRSLIASFQRREQLLRRYKRRYRPPPQPPSMLERLELSELQELLGRLVFDLPELYRETVLLCFFEGLSTRDVAGRQGVSESTVRSRRKRALDELRERLGLVFSELRNHNAVVLQVDPEPEQPAATATAPILVLDAAGQPVADAAVSFRPREHVSYGLGHVYFDELSTWMKPAEFREYARTNHVGTAEVPAGLLAREALKVEAPGFRPYRESLRLRSLKRPVEVRLEAASPAEAVVLLPDGSPACSVPIRLRGDVGAETKVQTNDKGVASFVWHDLLYVIEAEIPGCAATQSLASAPTTQLQLTPGRSAKGRVLSAAGNPVEGCQISIRFPGWPGQYDVGRTTDTGDFETPRLPDGGEFEVCLTHPDFAESHVRGQLPWQRRRVFRLEPGGQVTGKVIAPDGSPVQEGRVVLLSGRRKNRWGSPRYFAVAVRNGRYTIGSLPAGRYSVRLEHTELPGTVNPITVTAGGSVRHDIATTAGTCVAGRIVDPAGRPVPGVHLVCGGVFGSIIAGNYARTDADGFFCVPGLPSTAPETCTPVNFVERRTAMRKPGAWKAHTLLLRVSNPDQVLTKNGQPIAKFNVMGSSNTCEVAPGELDIELVLDTVPSKPTLMQLQDERGQRVQTHCYVSVTTSDGVTSDLPLSPDGTPLGLHDHNALPGSLLTVYPDGFRWVHLLLKPEESLPSTVTVERDPGVNPTVHVATRDQGPVSDGLIWLRPLLASAPPAHILAGSTDRSGRLALAGLADLDYEVLMTRGAYPAPDRSTATHFAFQQRGLCSSDRVVHLGHVRGGTTQRLAVTV